MMIMGISDKPKPVGERCAWYYRAQEYIRNDITFPERHKDCEFCTGYEQKPCYTTFSHLEQFAEMFQAKRGEQ